MKALRAKEHRNCVACGAGIPAGSVYFGERERAVSYREASHAGTLYPMRKYCRACAETRIAARKGCGDCGTEGERIGHMGCQYPQDR